METFWIFHLAASWRGVAQSSSAVGPPLATSPVVPALSGKSSETRERIEVLDASLDEDTSSSRPVIRAAAAQMVFASRSSQAFITPEQVIEVEEWSGRGVLEALCGFDIPSNVGVRPSSHDVQRSRSRFLGRDCILFPEVFGKRLNLAMR